MMTLEMNSAVPASVDGTPASETLKTTPRSLLGFLYSATYVASFRNALWADLGGVLEWFSVDNAPFVEACVTADRAAYLLRRYTNDADCQEPLNHAVVAKAQRDLGEAVAVLFHEAMLETKRQLAAGTLPQYAGVPAHAETTLLSATYAAVHHPEFRAAVLRGEYKQLAHATGADSIGLVRELARCVCDNITGPALADVISRVSQELADEYATLGWKICW